MVSVAGAVTSLFGAGRGWRIINDDTGEEVEGDFEATGVTRNVSSEYTRHTTLNRQHAITQYLHGNADSVTFQARLFQGHALDSNIEEKYEKLVEWTKRDKRLGRPPIVLFVVGGASTAYGDFFSTIDSISDAVFDSPTLLGEVRGITFTVNLTQFNPFDLTKANEGGNTRFHKVKSGEYAELIAAREYGEPLLGDVIRKLHPTLSIPQTGDTLGLPAIEIVRRETIEPKSLALTGLTKRKDNVNKTLRQKVADRLAVTFRSTIIPEGL